MRDTHLKEYLSYFVARWHKLSLKVSFVRDARQVRHMRHIGQVRQVRQERHVRCPSERIFVEYECKMA
jgi:hypothetical protein